MLLIPAFVPSTLAAYSVVGEREQGTLEPVLITPIRREEFLVGKALAVAVPTLTIAYAIFGIFLAVAKLFAHAGIASAIFAGTHVLVQLLFTPLLAGWSIWVGIAISARSSDIRVAQQLSVFASLPPLAIIALMQFKVITPSTGLALALAAALLIVDGLGLAGGRGDLRPRTTHHRQTSMTVAARLASVARAPRENALQNRRKSAMSATLKLTHKTIGVEIRRGTYDVVVDGKPAGSLELNETIDIPVEPGRHTLQVRNGRNSSRTKTFDAAEGETVAFRCGGKSILPIFLLSFVVPSLALSLHRE